MKIADAIAEARAIDARALADVLPPIEDTLRAFELVEFFAELVDGETSEIRKCTLALTLVQRLNAP